MTQLNLTDEQIDDEAFLEALLIAFGEDDEIEDDPDTLSRAWEAASGEGQVVS